VTETPVANTSVEDIDDGFDAPSAELERQADAILAEADAEADARPRPLREAVREDARMAGDWGRTRAARLRGTVEADPVRASLYALGIGVLIGLLAAR
jgi:hypothetical protein